MKNKARFGSKRQATAHGPRGQRLVNPPILTPDTAALLTQALAFHQAGLLTEAEALYRKLLLACPRHFDSLHMLGVIDYQRGDHASALRRIDHALNVDPRSASAHNNRGVVLVELGRLADAVASYDKAIAFAPGYIDAVVNRGNAFKDLERFEEALASYDRAIALNPSNADAFNKRGNVLTELRRFDEAITSYERAIALSQFLARPSTIAALPWPNSSALMKRLRVMTTRLRLSPTMPRPEQSRPSACGAPPVRRSVSKVTIRRLRSSQTMPKPSTNAGTCSTSCIGSMRRSKIMSENRA